MYRGKTGIVLRITFGRLLFARRSKGVFSPSLLRIRHPILMDFYNTWMARNREAKSVVRVFVSRNFFSFIRLKIKKRVQKLDLSADTWSSPSTFSLFNRSIKIVKINFRIRRKWKALTRENEEEEGRRKLAFLRRDSSKREGRKKPFALWKRRNRTQGYLNYVYNEGRRGVSRPS